MIRWWWVGGATVVGAVMLAPLMLAVSMATPPAASLAADTAPGGDGAAAVTKARTELGKPYVFGAAGPDAFDCSSLVQTAWAAAGVQLARTSQAQKTDPNVHLVPGVTAANVAKMAHAGDLIFYYPDVSHVALAIGGGKLIEASQPGQPVAIRPIYTAVFNSLGRVTPPAGSPLVLDSPTGGTVQAILQDAAKAHGWTGTQWQALQILEKHEAAFNPTARNASGAFGLGQALGHATPGSAGTIEDQYGANYGLTTAEAVNANSGDPVPQAKWMCNYIADRYGTPSAAMAQYVHADGTSWY